MIHSKIKKGETRQLLVELSTEKLPRVLEQFYVVCKDESVKIIRSPSLKSQKIRFYSLKMVDQKTNQNSNQQIVEIKDQIQQAQFKFAVIYVNEEDYFLPETPAQRTILIRQTLESFYNIDYEVENTLSQQQSLIYLCSLSSCIINCAHQGPMQLFDQRKDKMIRKGNQGDMSQTQVIWKNIIFQTPGVGREKCEAIVKEFPTYCDILKDYDGSMNLKNIKVERGAKQTKIGKAVADKIYKVFTSLNGSQLVN